MMPVLRVVLAVAAVLSVFLFPWPLTILLTLIAGFFWPPIALAVGILYELFYAPGTTLPWALIIGVIGTIILLFVQEFVKTRIIGG